MLREIEAVGQTAGEPKKRWFSSSDMDVFIWCQGEKDIVAFQFSYDKPHAEKSVRWSRDKGLRYELVDDGLRPGKYPASPILIEGSEFHLETLSTMLRINSGELSPWILNFILQCFEAASFAN